MAKSDLIHVQVEGNVFEGISDELAKFLENGGKPVDSQGHADLWQWSISSDNKLIINEILWIQLVFFLRKYLMFIVIFWIIDNLEDN